VITGPLVTVYNAPMELAKLFLENHMSLKDALDTIPVGVVVVNHKREAIYFNQIALEMTDKTNNSRQLGTPLFYGLYHEDEKTPYELDEVPSVRALRGEKVENLTVFLKNEFTPQGKFLNCAGSPLYDEDRIVGAVLTFKDITDRILDLRTKEEERQKIETNSRLATLGTILAEVGHEINNPLAILSSICWLLKDDLKNGKLDQKKLLEKVESIEQTLNRIHSIVGSLRNISRAPELTHSEAHALKDVWKDVKTICLPKLRPHHIKLDVNEKDPVLNKSFNGNRIQFSQVLINLILNAVDALEGHPSGIIKVDFSQADKTLLCRVSDNGPGITGDVKEKLFTPFFTTKPAGKGTGLGLSISKSLMQKLGGTLSFNPEICSSCFEVRLPLSEQQF
jgi:signal transduction histidine kinase